MSIAVILGPVNSARARPAHFVNAVIARLDHRARSVGQPLHVLQCRSDAELIAALSDANRGCSDLVIFNPGDCDCASAHVRGLLQNLRMPYIEAHDDDVGSLEPALAAGCGPRLQLVQGYGSQSYTLALSIALEHLGCAECDDRFHVGT